MEPYHDLYYNLFNRLTDLIAELQNIQQEMENRFISANCDDQEKGEQ